MSNLCIFTVNADDLLKASAARLNLNLCSYDVSPWPGYVTGKLRRGVEFLETRTESYAMWVDGHDTLLLKSEADIIKIFELSYSPVVLAAENNCWPDTFASRYYPAQHGPFINSGAFIGARRCLLAAMQAALASASDEDDQRAWTTTYIRQAEEFDITLDKQRRLFQCMGDGTPIADPCVLHWNGRTPGREEFWRKLTA